VTRAWLVWSGMTAGGQFPTAEAALRYCQVIANDHRSKRELDTVTPALFRYVGPRGKRHGRRLVAFIGTRPALETIGLDVSALLHAWAERA
jgi:hypothetical protein